MAGHIHGNPEQAEKDRFLREQLRARRFEVVEVRSFELDDRNAVVLAISRITKYLVGKERQRALRDDTTWFDRACEAGAPRLARVLRFFKLANWVPDAVPMFDLRVAAGAFSESHLPEAIGHLRLKGAAPSASFFAAKIVGDSMNEIAADGAWCLWQHLGTGTTGAAASGDLLLVRRPDERDPELGEFTFKQLVENEDGRHLVPRSSNPTHERIKVSQNAELAAVARFIAVLSEDLD